MALSGRQALDRRLVEQFPDVEPRCFRPLLSWDDGGPDPLSEVRAYEEGGAGAPRWRFVGVGLSELDEKRSSDPAVSGWGFELTLVAPRRGEAAPRWPADALQGIARHVVTQHDVLAEGDLVPTPEGPMAGFLFTSDPLGETPTSFGRVRWVQAIGVTPDEFALVQVWQTTPFLEFLTQIEPALATRPERRSVLEDPNIRARAQFRATRDGSSLGEQRTGSLGFALEGDQVVIELSVDGLRQLRTMLPARLPFGRPFRLVGPRCIVGFVPEGSPPTASEQDGLVELSDEALGILLPCLDESSSGGAREIDVLDGLVLRVCE